MVLQDQKKKKVRPIRILFILAAILVPTVHFLITYVYVNFSAVLSAFYRTVNGVREWGFENFTRFFEEFSSPTSEIKQSFVNTFKTWGIQLLLFPTGIVVSYFLYKKVLFANTFRLLFFMPGVISGVVTVAVYKGILSPEGQLAAFLQQALNLDYIPEILGDNRFANWGIWGMMIWLGIPGNMILWGGTFARIPDSLLESARLDGVSWTQELVYIIIPLVWPTFSMLLMFQLSGIFGASGSVFLLTEGLYGTQTFSNWMYMQVYNYTGGNSNAFNYMAAVGLLITVVASIIAYSVRYFANKIESVEF